MTEADPCLCGHRRGSHRGQSGDCYAIDQRGECRCRRFEADGPDPIRDCEHGQLRRSCEICELTAERDALRARVAELEAAIESPETDSRLFCQHRIPRLFCSACVPTEIL